MQSIIYNFAVVDSVFLQNEAWTGWSNIQYLDDMKEIFAAGRYLLNNQQNKTNAIKTLDHN